MILEKALCGTSLIVTSVLDLGCGRGGDLGKFVSSGIRSYVGIDLANHNILEARNRSARMNKRNTSIELLQGDFAVSTT